MCGRNELRCSSWLPCVLNRAHQLTPASAPMSAWVEEEGRRSAQVSMPQMEQTSSAARMPLRPVSPSGALTQVAEYSPNSRKALTTPRTLKSAAK